MSILKKKALWFTLYGILITVIFLYLLFPSDIVKSRLEECRPFVGFYFEDGKVAAFSASGD